MIDASVPMLWHIVTVLLLLSAHGLTAKLAFRRIETLQMALVAKKVLLGGMKLKAGTHILTSGQQFTLQGTNGQTLLTVETIGSICTVRTFDA